MRDIQTVSAPKRFFLVAFALVLWPNIIITAEVGGSENESQELRKNSTDGEEFYEQFYEWSVWSPCSRTCGIGIKFKGQLCLRENKALCEKKPRTYETCNTQACPQGSKNFRDVQCGQYNGRDIFINGERATWMSYVRGDNQCLLFCYPYGEDLFYYFGRARDGTQCSKEPYGVCVFGRCKPVGCDKKLESGVYLDKCRVCGGNSTTCQPIRGRIERSPSQFERLTGYAELMVIPKGSTSVFLTDTSWNYLALRRQNGEYIVNGNRIINWSGIFKVGDLEVEYKRLSNNIGETIQIFGPTSEDLFVTSLLITGKLNTTFEYWKPVTVGKIAEDAPEAGAALQSNHSSLQMGWGSWTACSASCGGGIKVRARYPSITSFRGKEAEVKKCNVEPCDKMVAVWSEWGPWDDCSTTCGGGARIRFRYCKKHSASAGSGCPGKRYAVEQCNVATCPEKEARPSTSKIDGHATVASSQALHTQEAVTRLNSSVHVTASSPNMTFVRKTFSESLKMPRTVSTHTKTPKIPSASQLISQSYLFQYPDISAESSSEDVKQKTLSRLGERYSSSSTLNVIRFSELLLLESSTKQAIPSFGSDFSTTTHKEISTFPSRSRGVEVHQPKLSESSVKEKLSLSASRVRQSTVTSAYLPSNASELPGFVHSIRPSPVSKDSFATTRQFKSPMHSIESASLLETGVAISSDVVSVDTVSDYRSEKSLTVSDRKPALVSSSKDEVFNSSSLAPFTSHSMEAINSSSTHPYPRTSLQKTRYVVTEIFPTPFLYGEKSTVMNSSFPSTVDQTSILESTKIRSLKPLISFDHSSVGAKTTSLTETSLKRSVQGSPTSIYESSVQLKPDSMMPMKKNSTFLLWNHTIGSESFSELIVGTSISENATELSSSSPLVLSPIDYFETPEVISSTKSRTIGQSDETDDLRILVSSALTTYMPLKSSLSRLKVLSSVPILQTSKLPSTPFVAQIKASLPFSRIIESSTVTEGGYLHFTTSASQLPSLPLKGETITKHASRLQEQSSRSTMKTSKLLSKPRATQISSSLSPFVTKRRGYVNFTTSQSYPQLSAPLKREPMTRASSNQRTQSFTLIAETSKLSITHLATDFKQLLSASSILKPSIVTQRGRLFLSTETARSVVSTIEEEAIARPLHSLTSLSSRPIVPLSMSTSRTSKLPITSLVSEINSSLSLSSAVKSSVVTQAGYPYLRTSSFSELSSSGDMYSLPTQRIISSLSTLLASKRRETPLSAEKYSSLAKSSILKSFNVTQGGHRFLETSPLLRFTSTFAIEDTETFMDDLISSSRQVLLSPSPQSSSSLQVEATASLSASKTISSSKREVLSPPLLYASLTRKVEPLISPMDSLSSSSSMQRMLLSVFSQSSSSQEVEPTKSHVYSLTSSMLLQRVQSSPSWRFSTAQQGEGTESRVGSGRSSPLTKCIPSSMPPLFSSSLNVEATKNFLDSSTSSSFLKFSPSQKIGTVTGLLDSLRSSSSGQYTGNAVFPHLSLPVEEKVTTRLIKSSPSLPSRQHLKEESAMTSPVDSLRSSSSRHYILLSQSRIRPSSALKEQLTRSYLESSASLPSRQQILSPVYPRITSALKVESTIGNLSRSLSSKHKIPSSPSLQASSVPKEEITTSFMDSSRPSPSKHEMVSLSSPQFSSAPKIQITRGLLDSSKTSSSKHYMPSLLSTQASSAAQVEIKTSLTRLSTTSSSKLEMPSSPSPQFSSTPKDEVTNSLADSMRTFLSKHKMQSLLPSKGSSTPKVAETISFTNSLRTSSSKHEIPSLVSLQFSSTPKLEVTTSLMDSIITSSSKHEMPSWPSPLVNSVPTVEFTTTIMGSLTASSLKQEMPSLPSPPARSTPKVEITTSLMESLRTSLSKSLPSLLSSSTPKVEMKTSLMDLFSTFSLKHKMPSLSPLQLNSEATTRSPEESLTSSSSHHPIMEVASMKSSKIFSTSSSSRQHVIASFSPQLSSLVKEEATKSISNSSTVPSSRQRSVSSTFAVKVESAINVLDSLISSSSRQIISSQFSSAPKVETSTTLKRSLTSQSPSKHQIVLSVSPSFSSALNVETRTSSVEPLSSSLSREQIPSSPPQLSPPLRAEAATVIMCSIINLSSRTKILSSRSPQLNPSIEVEYTANLKESLRILSSRQPILSSTAPQFSSQLQVNAMASHMESISTSLLSRERTLSSISPQFRSVEKDKLSTSLMGSFTSSLTEQFMLSSVSTVQTTRLPSKPLANKVDYSFPVPSIFTSSIFDEEGYTFVTTSTSTLLNSTPAMKSSQRFLISLSSSRVSVLPKRSTADLSISYDRQFTNYLKEGDSSLTLVSRGKRHQTVTATIGTSSIPSSALKAQTWKMVVSSLKPTTVKVAAAPTPTAVQEEKSTQCPPCDLSQRLKEKYCYSDYAILVRIRSEAVVNGSQTSYAAKVRKVFKTNKPMKKKPEIRFNNGSCNCRTDLFMKRDYLVFGKHVPLNGTIGFLEVNRDSFVSEWNGALQKEIEQLEGHCSLNSLIPTPHMSSTVTFSSGASWQFMKKATTTALLSTRSDNQVETPTSRDWTEASTTESSATTSAVEEKCGPCEIVIKRTRAYCTSDFVIHVKILSEAINEFNHDANYRVRLIHTFRMKSGVTAVTIIWILGNQCRCPLLLPGKQYLLMGRLGMRAGSSEPIAEINRESYVEVWRESMIRRLPDLKKRCPLKTTQSSTLVAETTGYTTVATVPSATGTRISTEEISSQPPTTQPTLTPPVKCRPCRITKKRNKSYCESDFVIRARVLQASFNDTLRERKYRVRIIKVFKNIVDLKVRENIFVVNDDCQCPKLELREQYVIMGTVETISITDIRLVIPPRPFVWMWKSRMETGLESVICGN